ncbi:MAG: hypothetical protein N3A61_09405, partial [Ignavibacteria bacterium]|nr:hypothetical protein [Ignavibacteria bacterium]
YKSHKLFEENKNLAIARVTAIWGFCESALGGILHALKIPFTGLFIGSSAVLFISLIALLSDKRMTILKSTFIVLVIKGVVSPYTPISAFIAVFIQGFLGEILFFNKNFFKLSAFVLGFISLLYSAFQKIFVLTIIFGVTLWKSLDDFFNFVLKQLPLFSDTAQLQFSYLIIGIYTSIHLVAGIAVGIWAGRLPRWLNKNLDENNEIPTQLTGKLLDINNKPHKRKKWWQKKSGKLLFAFFLLMIVLSYFFPEFGKDKLSQILIMILRAVSILIIWYYFISPILLKIVKVFLKKKQNSYSKEVQEAIELFPHFKVVINYVWSSVAEFKGYTKLKRFLSHTLALLLFTKFSKE